MILGKRNIAFMHGPEHKALRRSFLALFSRRALSMYVEQQDVVIRTHLTAWLAAAEARPGPVEVRDMVRDMNCATSQAVFIGAETRPRALGGGFEAAFLHCKASHACNHNDDFLRPEKVELLVQSQLCLHL